MLRTLTCLLFVLTCFLPSKLVAQSEDRKTMRVFIFAGQSNMVGADSKVADIEHFPPFVGLNQPQRKVRFAYCIGRETKQRSEWTELQPVDGLVGPELSFGDRVSKAIDAPIGIIKIAAGGTALGDDWNPDQPAGFELYPLALQTVRDALRALDRKSIRWRLEGFMWHQGENDSFNDEFRKNYGTNLAHFLACWRRDLEVPDLRFYIGELCTKTIWGMDLRATMYEIALGQRAVTDVDPRAEFVRTAHVGVEIGGGVGLHYHYGTLGQLEHGVNYAEAYLRSIDKFAPAERILKRWPYAEGSAIDLYVLAGHRNMEGERAFAEHLRALKGKRKLCSDLPDVAYRYNVGGGFLSSDSYEPLGLCGPYGTFGPEISFAHALHQAGAKNFAIAKFTHSGSQMIDWDEAGSMATRRNLYPAFLSFVRDSITELEARGHRVNLKAICYHLGENDMSYSPYRKAAPSHLASIMASLRRDLGQPELFWLVSQQPPTDHPDVNAIDVVAEVRAVLEADQHAKHVLIADLPTQREQLVFDAAGVVALGEQLAAQLVP